MRIAQFIKSAALLIGIFLFGLVPSSNAQFSMPMPPHYFLFTSVTRGYWFIAPAKFTITGLRVPPEAGTGTQNIQVFKLNSALVIYPDTGTNFTNLAYIKGAPNGVIQNVDITIYAGDTIGIFGTAGQSGSYSTSIATPYNSTILGHNVPLYRIIYQGNIDVNAAPNYSIEISGNNIGRIQLYYTCLTPSADSIVAEQISPCLFNFKLANTKNADSYRWDFGDGTPRSSVPTPAHAYSSSGSYAVKAVLRNDCDSTVLLKAVYCNATGIDKNQLDNETIKLYPNPASNVLTIKSENAIMLKEVIIYNLLGQKVYETEVQNQHQYSINITHMPSGIYSVYIKTDKDVVIRKVEVLK